MGKEAHLSFVSKWHSFFWQHVECICVPVGAG